MKGEVSRGALAWAGALEQLLENPERLGADAQALAKHLKATRSATGVKVALLTGRDFEPRRFRLLLPRLRVVLHPRLLRNVETVGLLDRLKAEIEAAAPEALAPLIQVARTEVADPTADIDCQAVASAKLAYLECVEGRTPLFADRIDISEPATALAPVVQQILRDYRRLVARDWSARSGAVRPVDVVLLLDQSLSMAWHDPTHAVDPGLPLDGPAKREVALVRIAATLGAHAMSTGLRARLSVLMFGEQVAPLPLGPGGEEWLRLDKRLSGDTLAGLAQRFRTQAKPARYTGIASALDAAAARVAGGSPEAARHVILITDGVESVVTESPREAVRAAASRVKAAGATLHTLGLSEQRGRLPAFLETLRKGGPPVQRYANLREMAFAPAACQRPEPGSDIARRCGDFYARMIESTGGYDPALLDEIRRSDRAGVPTGLCLLTDERTGFQRTLPELLSALTGEGVYATRHGVRQNNPLDPSIVLDTWRFDLDLRTSARVLIYNRDALDFTEWAVLQDGRKLTPDDGLEVVSESDAVTVVTLPAPARGVWIVQRQGRLAALGAAQEGARP